MRLPPTEIPLDPSNLALQNDPLRQLPLPSSHMQKVTNSIEERKTQYNIRASSNVEVMPCSEFAGEVLAFIRVWTESNFKQKFLRNTYRAKEGIGLQNQGFAEDPKARDQFACSSRPSYRTLKSDAEITCL